MSLSSYASTETKTGMLGKEVRVSLTLRALLLCYVCSHQGFTSVILFVCIRNTSPVVVRGWISDWMKNVCQGRVIMLVDVTVHGSSSGVMQGAAG